jgi:hypothetical protein
VSAEETEMAAAARTYVNAGWRVFPLWWVVGGRCACPAGEACTSPGKHPLTRRGLHDATTDLERVATWWHICPHANIGIPAGDNGLAVLDVDPRHGGHVSLSRLVDALEDAGTPLPTTLSASTGGGGLHLIYAAPEGGIKGGSNVFGASMTGLDTRGRGGYIVAPPSVHATGRPYRWLSFLADIAPWPAALSALMDPAAAVAATRPARTAPAMPAADDFLFSAGGYAAVAMRGELARVHGAAEGERNHTLNRAAFALGQLVAAGLLDGDLVLDELVTAGLEIGLGLSETRATVRSGLRGGARAPREVGAVAA